MASKLSFEIYEYVDQVLLRIGKILSFNPESSTRYFYLK